MSGPSSAPVLKADAKANVPAGRRPGLRLVNLLNDLETLSRLLTERAALGDVQNSYLLAAGMAQIAEDYLHRDRLHLQRAGSRMQRRAGSGSGRLAGSLLCASAGTLAGLTRIHPDHRRTVLWLGELNQLVMKLAAELAEVAPAERGPVLEAARALSTGLRQLPQTLRRDLLRLPSSFRNFDQRVEDLALLADRLSSRWRESPRPLAVVGVRTSGSYLAPLLAVMLADRLGRPVPALTVRPGQPWLPPEAQMLRRLLAAGGCAILVDDPPGTGGSLAAAARQLGGLGFPTESILLALQLFTSEAELPAMLRPHPAALLPWPEWAVHRHLSTEAVRESLAGLLGHRARLLDIRPAGTAAATGRTHASAVFEVDLEAPGSVPQTTLVRARGVGLGYFGEHALAISERLGEHAPRMFGLAEGVVHEVLPDPRGRLAEPLQGSQLTALATYVHARSRRLGLEHDPSLRLAYRGAAWQRAGHTLAAFFGPRLADPARPLAAALALRLLEVDSPSVPDGVLALEHFAPGPLGLAKVDADTGPFTSPDDYCFDPVYDLARLGLGLNDPQLATRLRREYEVVAGTVEPERWLLYRLLLLAEEGVDRGHGPLARERLLAQAVSEYYGETVLGGASPDPAGRACAIDLDGVLETSPLGFPATTPSGAGALRALILHGYRPLIATGRSLPEVAQRCRAYGLAGGVAEYGAATFDAVLGGRGLLEPADQRLLDRLRSGLSALDGVELDSEFRFSIRAFRLSPDGGPRKPWARRRCLDSLEVAEVLASTGLAGLVRAVQGIQQTDFVVGRFSKEAGLAALLAGQGGRPPALAFAMGDTASDLGMLASAEMAAAPANADQAVRAAGVTLTRRPFQRGLSESVARLIGHPPGSCPTCAAPSAAAGSRLLLQVLEMEELGRLGKLGRLARLLSERSVRERLAW